MLLVGSVVTPLYDDNSIQLQRAPPVGWVTVKRQPSMDNILVGLSLKAVKMLWLTSFSLKTEIIKRPQHSTTWQPHPYLSDLNLSALTPNIRSRGTSGNVFTLQMCREYKGVAFANRVDSWTII